MSSTASHNRMPLTRCRRKVALINMNKLKSCYKMIYSVILFMIIQMIIQIRHSESTRQPLEQQIEQQHSLFNADPIVFNADSLYKSHNRHKRSTQTSGSQNQRFVDACQSKMEVLTPYYATNSRGKLRTIVNSELMQQAIQVETCTR